MNTSLKITKIGNSAGIVLPKEVLAHLGVAIGDALDLTTTPDGIALMRQGPDKSDQMAVARDVMARRQMALKALADVIQDEDREVLAALAKS